MKINVLYKPLVIDIVEQALDIEIKHKRVIDHTIDGWHVWGCKVIRSGTDLHGFRINVSNKAYTFEHMVTVMGTQLELLTYQGGRRDDPPSVSKFDLHDPRSVGAIVSALRQRTRGL